MKTLSKILRHFSMAGGLLAVALLASPAHGIDMFGSGANQFGIEFVIVGNAGNAHDTGGGGGSYSSLYGDVAYDYRISRYEISQDMIDKATNSGMSNVTAGAWSGDQPAAEVTWYEAAAFVNWLNTSKGHQAAYDLTYSGGWSMNLWSAGDQAATGVDSGTNAYRHKDAFYFLPSEDEWYKAAYHQNDGVTANYWDYPTGSNAVPDGIDSSGDPSFDAVFHDGHSELAPNDIDDAGSAMSAYGTYGQGGNVWEWLESAYDGTNDSSTKIRGQRGGYWNGSEVSLRSSERSGGFPISPADTIGFRVASVPEPSAALLMFLGSGVLMLRRRR